MKIQELLEAKKKKVATPDDFDDQDDAPEDPESDKIPHIVMQLRKALDVEGDHPIIFKDGKRTKLPIEVIRAFLTKYIQAKPSDREAMQNIASTGIEGFKNALKGSTAPGQKSIYAYK